MDQVLSSITDAFMNQDLTVGLILSLSLMGVFQILMSHARPKKRSFKSRAVSSFLLTAVAGFIGYVGTYHLGYPFEDDSGPLPKALILALPAFISMKTLVTGVSERVAARKERKHKALQAAEHCGQDFVDQKSEVVSGKLAVVSTRWRYGDYYRHNYVHCVAPNGKKYKFYRDVGDLDFERELQQIDAEIANGRIPIVKVEARISSLMPDGSINVKGYKPAKLSICNTVPAPLSTV